MKTDKHSLLLIILCLGLLQNVCSQEQKDFRVDISYYKDKSDTSYSNLNDFTVSYFKNNWLIHQKRFLNNRLWVELLCHGDTAIETSYYQGTSIIQRKSYYLVSKDSLKDFTGIDDYIYANWHLQEELFDKKGKIESREFYKKVPVEDGHFCILNYSEEYKRGKLKKCYTFLYNDSNGNFGVGNQIIKQVKCK